MVSKNWIVRPNGSSSFIYTRISTNLSLDRGAADEWRGWRKEDFLSRPVTIIKQDTAKNRLVVDLNHLIGFGPKREIMMVTITQVHLQIQEGTWLSALDLQDSVPMT